MNPTSTDTQVIIIGGGLVGTSLAVALGQVGVSVAVVESRELKADQNAHYDDRTIALAQGSQQILSGLGVWAEIGPQACPIEMIHVSERGHFGMTRLRADEEAVSALGYVAPARVIGAALAARMATLSSVDMLAPAEVVRLDLSAGRAVVDVDVAGRMEQCQADLLVAADGSRSGVREMLSIDVHERDYGQTAIIANLSPELPHNNVAYERFTDTGPMALLPMTDQRCALVWTLATEAVAAVLALDDEAFLARVQERFGYRLGKLQKVGKRDAFPLSMMKSSESVRAQLALIGNAMHTLHPVAGQGFNLGLRDVASLAEVIVDALQAGESIGDLAVLEKYRQWRQQDQSRVMTFTDGLIQLFSMPSPPVRLLRNCGMVVMDLLPPVKRLFGKATMGRAGRLPRLARGLPL
ncbi:MAG: 2-octaprenyl-6-methoxyphenyl hydroxylase [Gammaproteobacteria bacterium]